MKTYLAEFKRYKAVIDKAVAQVDDEAFNHIPYPDGNSIAMLLRHLAGNLHSRFTEFWTADGEKSWRHRDEEFVDGPFGRAEVLAHWESGWNILEDVLSNVKEADRHREITIRGVPFTAQAAFNRSKAHIAYHAGQIVLLARMHQGSSWEWITIPKGKSEEYNQNPHLEKGPLQ